MQCWLVVILMAAYLATLTPGHVFTNDDFAAYVMHARNLVEGRPYSSLHYILNPEGKWIGPPEGYPPVYPLLLTPSYKLFGFNLRMMKVLTVIPFGLFLTAYFLLLERVLPFPMRLFALVVMGCNPFVWTYRDYLLSEFPYMMFCFWALLVMDRVYETLPRHRWEAGRAILLALLLYCTYGTRTIGLVLLLGFCLADFLRFKRISRFLLIVVFLAASLIIVQNLFLQSPRGYMDAFHPAGRWVLKNSFYYAKVLSYTWENGFSKKAQIVFALLFTALAAVNFSGRLWKKKFAGAEFYVLLYLAVLVSWSAEIGLRGLLPILPLYFAYGLAEFWRIVNRVGRNTRAALVAALLLSVGGTYATEHWHLLHQAHEPNVLDPTAQELFSFLRDRTQPGEVLIFTKPRSLALFTNRTVASLTPDESPEDSARFIEEIHATILVQANWDPQSLPGFVARNRSRVAEVFTNADYRVFRMTPQDPQGIGPAELRPTVQPH